MLRFTVSCEKQITYTPNEKKEEVGGREGGRREGREEETERERKRKRRKERREKEKKGKSQFKIDSILGRQDDILLLPDGTRLGRIGRVFMEVEGLELAQVHQKVQDSFAVNLVVNKYFNEQSVSKIHEKLSKLGGNQLRYDINYVQNQDIIRTRAGKYKLVINEISETTEKGQVTI